MTTREVWALLRFCGYIHNLSKVYGKDWVKSENNIIGFYGDVYGNGAKEVLLERIRIWCLERKLPVEIINDPFRERRFKIKLLK